MLIMAVIAVTAVPRISGTETFSVIGSRDVALSVARQVQLRAMQQDLPSASCHALVITASRFGGSDDPLCNRLDMRSDALDLLGSGIEVTPPQRIHFNLLGRPLNADGSRACYPTECTITFAKASVSSSLCLNGEGYFYGCNGG